MGARHTLAHALCEARFKDCRCSRDPWKPACMTPYEEASAILRLPLERRLRLVQAVAGGDPDEQPGLHDRLVANGIHVSTPAPIQPEAEPGPTLTLGESEPAAEPDLALNDEEQMKRAAGRAWRA